MINFFTQHPKENGYDGYFSHLRFAAAISLRLLASSCVFLAHSIFPFIAIPKFLNLERTIQYLTDKNEDTK